MDKICFGVLFLISFYFADSKANIGESIDFQAPSGFNQIPAENDQQIYFYGKETIENSQPKKPVIIISKVMDQTYSLQSNKPQAGVLAYQNGRIDWLKKVGGKLIDFIAYKDFQLGKSTSAYAFGFIFDLMGNTYLDSSTYITCPDAVYHIKFLLTGSQISQYSTLESTIQKFQCRRI